MSPSRGGALKFPGDFFPGVRRSAEWLLGLTSLDPHGLSIEWAWVP